MLVDEGKRLVCTPLPCHIFCMKQGFESASFANEQEVPFLFCRHRCSSRSDSSCGVPLVCMPVVLGVVLLHPNLSGVMGPAFSRLLARSKLGRSILRPLLRTEIGELCCQSVIHSAATSAAQNVRFQTCHQNRPISGFSPSIGRLSTTHMIPSILQSNV